MRFTSTETPTFAGSAGSGTAPTVAERLNIVDRSGNVLAYFDKAVDGTFTYVPTSGATSTEIDRFNDVSAYQETVIAAGAMSLTKVVTKLELAATGAVTLAAPDASMYGQTKLIEMTVDNGDVTFALTNVVGQSSGTGATFNDVGDALVLMAMSDKWLVIKERGITLA